MDRNTAKKNMMKFCKDEDIISSQDDIDNYEPYYFLSGPHIIYEGTNLDDRDMWHRCILRGEKQTSYGVRKQHDGNWVFFKSADTATSQH